MENCPFKLILGFSLVLILSSCKRDNQSGSTQVDKEQPKVATEQWIEYTSSIDEEIDTTKSHGRIIKSLKYANEGNGKIMNEFSRNENASGALAQKITHYDSLGHVIKIVSYYNPELTVGSTVEYQKNDSHGNPTLLINYDIEDGKETLVDETTVLYEYDTHGEITKSTISKVGSKVSVYTQQNTYNTNDQIERRVVIAPDGQVQSDFSYSYSNNDVTSEVYSVPALKIKRETTFTYKNGLKTSEKRKDENNYLKKTTFEYQNGLLVKTVVDDKTNRRVVFVKRTFF